MVIYQRVMRKNTWLRSGAAAGGRVQHWPQRSGIVRLGRPARGGHQREPHDTALRNPRSKPGRNPRLLRENPVRVGGRRSAGLRNQLRYLNALKGPKGQNVTCKQQASWCAFRTVGK